MDSLIDRIPVQGSRLLISSLSGSASLAMSTRVLKALPGKLDIKRHSPSILYNVCIKRYWLYTFSNVMQSHPQQRRVHND